MALFSVQCTCYDRTVLVQFVSMWKGKFARDVWCENVRTKDKKRLWRRKEAAEPFPYPWKEQERAA